MFIGEIVSCGGGFAIFFHFPSGQEGNIESVVANRNAEVKIKGQGFEVVMDNKEEILQIRNRLCQYSDTWRSVMG